MIEYSLQLADPGAHEFAIQLSLDTEPGQTLSFVLPAWIPGSYMIRDFARNLMDLRALDGQGRPVAFSKIDKQTWSLEAPSDRLTLRYRVYAFDESVRSAYFDNTRAFFNGTSVFLRVSGREKEVHRLTLDSPGDSIFASWRVATTLPPLAVNDSAFGTYEAADYAQLIDHPFEIGNHETVDFSVAERPHRLLLVDAGSADIQRIAHDLAPILEEHAAMFGDLPVDRYLFLTLATAAGYGGLEHRDSTMLVCKRADLPYPGMDKISKGYRTFLALCSHEYFHLWNVKRIRPQVLAQASLETEAHTELLWAFEGITSYYDELALARAGTLDASGYLDMLAPSVTRYFRNPGRKRQTVAESSFDAWTRFYKQDDNAPNAIVSYYNKGALVALGMDHLLRTVSDDTLSLDHLMRWLWQRYGQSGIGLAERQIEKDLEELLGKSVADFFAAYVYGMEELPLQQWFADFGIGMRLRPSAGGDDAGGLIAGDATLPSAVLSLGARTAASEDGLRIEQTVQGGAARNAGLSTGDLLVAIDGERCTVANLAELLSRRVAGDSIVVTYFRRDLLASARVELGEPEADTCDLWLLPEASLSPAVLQRRASWLRSARKAG